MEERGGKIDRPLSFTPYLTHSELSFFFFTPFGFLGFLKSENVSSKEKAWPWRNPSASALNIRKRWPKQQIRLRSETVILMWTLVPDGMFHLAITCLLAANTQQTFSVKTWWLLHHFAPNTASGILYFLTLELDLDLSAFGWTIPLITMSMLQQLYGRKHPALQYFSLTNPENGGIITILRSKSIDFSTWLCCSVSLTLSSPVSRV